MPRRSHTNMRAPRTPPNHRRCAHHVYDALAGGLAYIFFFCDLHIFSVTPTLIRVGVCRPPGGGATYSQGRPLPPPRPPLGAPFAPPPIPRPPLALPPLPFPRAACAARLPCAILARFPRCTWYAASAAASALLRTACIRNSGYLVGGGAKRKSRF